jgi:hypothetical protein
VALAPQNAQQIQLGKATQFILSRPQPVLNALATMIHPPALPYAPLIALFRHEIKQDRKKINTPGLGRIYLR